MTADDTVTAKLAEWETLAEAATEGPWAVPHDHEEVYGDTCVTIGDYGWVASGPEGQGPAYDVDSEQGRADAEFIGHAREMVPALLGFVRKVRKIHFPNWYETEEVDLCNACIEEEWPCPTEQAARKWIGGEGRG